MNAIIYVRYNPNNQSGVSIEKQLVECRKYAKNHNCSIVGEYIDDYKDVNNRTEFNKMMEDSKQHLFDTVITYSPDRFGRNRYGNAIDKTRLKQNGVKVFFADSGITRDPASVLMDSVLEGMAEYLQQCYEDTLKELL